MSHNTHSGRHQLEFTVGDSDHITVKADVDFDHGVVIDWSAEDWNGNEAFAVYGYDYIYDLCCDEMNRRWKAEQRLITLILTELDDVI